MKKLILFPLLFSCYFVFGQNESWGKSITGKLSRIDFIDNSAMLFVAQYNLPNLLNWYDANEYCAKLGDGWRLPTQYELNKIYQDLHLKKISYFPGNYYWSSTEHEEITSKAWGQRIPGGEILRSPKSDKANVRCVYLFRY